MKASMKFDYILNGKGWVYVEIEIDDKQFFSFPSYISEPLIEFLDGLLYIIPGCVPADELKHRSTFKWFQEPGVDKWSLELTKNKDLKILIETFENESADEGRVEISTVCDLKEFLTEVVKSLEKLIDKHGFVGYKNTWLANDFPISSFLKLKYYLDNLNKYPTKEGLNEFGAELEISDLNEELKLICDRSEYS